MMPIAANNQYKTRAKDGAAAWREGQSGMPFPGVLQVYDLLDDTNPAAALYNGSHSYSALMGQPIRNITENEDGTITLCFRTNGQLNVPEGLEAQEVGMDGFIASWLPVEHAIGYAVEMIEENGAYHSDTIQDCSFKYEGLQPSSAVKMRVKALSDSPENYIESEWSDYVEVETDVDYMPELPESEKVVMVYTVDGKAVSQCPADEIYRLRLRPGIYVMKYSNGATKKIMLR